MSRSMTKRKDVEQDALQCITRKNFFLRLYKLLNNFTQSRMQRHWQFRLSNSDCLRQRGCEFSELFHSFALYYQFLGVSYYPSFYGQYWILTWRVLAQASTILRIARRCGSRDPVRRQWEESNARDIFVEYHTPHLASKLPSPEIS